MQNSQSALLTIAVFTGILNAQVRPYVGAVGGVSTLSADARTTLDSGSAAASSYKPENGLTAGVFAGLHWTNYFSVQSTFWRYNIGFPVAGFWKEVFNSDVYDHFVNPITAGNGGGVYANGPGMHGFVVSASLVVPANVVVVFARQ